MTAYEMGASVTVTEGPFTGLFGTLIYVDETRDRYLVRFAGNQQLYFPPGHVVPWESRDS